MHSSVRTLTCTALFAALTGVLTQIAIPLPGLVPINLATLSVFLCGALLGAKWGFISQIVYLCIGFVGVPVFSSMQAGPAILAGPTGGYLAGYLLAALLVGLLLEKKPVRFMLPVSMALGAAVYYTLGTLWYMHYMNQAASASAEAGGIGLIAALMACVFPFLPGDALKILAASFVAQRIGILKYRPRK